jgi:hypothetical protein
MMQCRRCNRIAAMAGVFCVCGEMFIAAVEASVSLYDQPHIHQEMDLPTKPTRPIVVAVSTSTSSTSSDLSIQANVDVQSPWDALSIPRNPTVTVWQSHWPTAIDPFDLDLIWNVAGALVPLVRAAKSSPNGADQRVGVSVLATVSAIEPR